jgi:hypothetical protein
MKLYALKIFCNVPDVPKEGEWYTCSNIFGGPASRPPDISELYYDKNQLEDKANEMKRFGVKVEVVTFKLEEIDDIGDESSNENA